MQQRSEETRGRILQAAIHQISLSGYNAASVADICAEAGISKGAFYHHYTSKQEVFIALLNVWLVTVDASLNAARQQTALLTLMHMSESLPAILASARGYLPMFLEFWQQASHDEAIWAQVNAPYQRYQEYFAQVVQEGIIEDSFRPVDPQATAQMIVSLAVGLFLQALLAPQGTDWQKIAQQSMEILIKGLAM